MNNHKIFKKNQHVWFYCEGCDTHHQITVEQPLYPSPVWGWNGSLAKPTFTPSILVRWNKLTAEGRRMAGAGEKPPNGKYPTTPLVCHSFVTDGNIQYLGDCTHHLANKTVELKPIDETGFVV